jgi:hypothetical protein
MLKEPGKPMPKNFNLLRGRQSKGPSLKLPPLVLSNDLGSVKKSQKVHKIPDVLRFAIGLKNNDSSSNLTKINKRAKKANISPL